MGAVGFRVGGAERECALIQVLGSIGDGWLQSKVTIRVGGFSGEFPSDLDDRAFVSFLAQLRGLYERLSGTAAFNTYEKQLELSLTGDGRGHVAVAGTAMDIAGTGNRLNFRLQIDQTDLPRLIREVEEVVTRYPPRSA